MGFYNKLFCFSIILTVIAILVLIFALFIFGILISSEARSSAVLAADNADLWGDIPGRSKVQIIRDHYFYNLNNFDDLINDKSPANTEEVGPYRINENQKFINLNFTNDDNVVHYNYFRFMGPSNETKLPLTDTITTLNLVLLFITFIACNGSMATAEIYSNFKSSFTSYLYYSYRISIRFLLAGMWADVEYHNYDYGRF